MLKVYFKHSKEDIFVAFFIVLFFNVFYGEGIETPKFAEAIGNVTTPLGREAILTCIVDNLQTFKVAWLRVDTQTILTIAGHVITKNHRIGVTQADNRAWKLHIKELREADRGWYMCQLNTEPMRSQMGYLEVVVPPDIVDEASSSDVVVKEGGTAKLSCVARGSPQPNVTWRRENNRLLPLPNGTEGVSWEGGELIINKTSRLHAGAYLCIASNGVPPSVSKRITLSVNFAPMIWIQNQLVGAVFGESAVLECHSESSPKPTTFWSREKGEVISDGEKYNTSLVDMGLKFIMGLIINEISQSDVGMYKCISKNSLGETDGSIKLYGIPPTTTTTSTTTSTTTTTTTTEMPTTVTRVTKKQLKSRHNTIPNRATLVPEYSRNYSYYNFPPTSSYRDVGSTVSFIDSSPRKTSPYNNISNQLLSNFYYHEAMLLTLIIFLKNTINYSL